MRVIYAAYVPIPSRCGFCRRDNSIRERLGATAELRSLQLLDDELEALDLTVAALDDNSHLAHQTVQQRRIGRQIFKIEPHVRTIVDVPAFLTGIGRSAAGEFGHSSSNCGIEGVGKPSFSLGLKIRAESARGGTRGPPEAMPWHDQLIDKKRRASAADYQWYRL
jgi:hypothetical protein